MRVLAINCGSSTLKFQVIETSLDQDSLGQERHLASGTVERIGGQGAVRFSSEEGEEVREEVVVADHSQAMRKCLDLLRSTGYLDRGMIHAAGHRIVHGGDRFTGPTILDAEVIDAIDGLGNLAPLHNKPAVEAMRSAWSDLGTSMPMVAVFDTTFHRTLPDRASKYPISPELAARHGVRRFGFHGLAHYYMTERYAALNSALSQDAKLITLQLGSGCSAAAIQGGRSVDTSMGLTPLEGLMMGTRTGDVDPVLLGYLARREGVEIETMEEWFNTSSGLLGVSGTSNDMRDLLEAESQGDPRAALAVDMFCYRVCKYIGAYLAVLGGADAIVFGGGIGENAPEVRSRICATLEWCGLVLDAERNNSTVASEGRITSDDARIHAHVVKVNEEAIIARETARCLSQQRV